MNADVWESNRIKLKRAGVLLNFPEAFIKMIFRVKGNLGVE